MCVLQMESVRCCVILFDQLTILSNKLNIILTYLAYYIIVKYFSAFVMIYVCIKLVNVLRILKIPFLLMLYKSEILTIG